MSVRPSSRNDSALTGSIFTKFDNLVFIETLSKKIQVPLKSKQENTNSLHEDQHTRLIICCSVPIRMRIVSDKSCREKQKPTFYIQ